MDIRAQIAKYYDLHSVPYGDDFPFYIDRIASADAKVLELGCGTGRVLIPLAKHCGYIHGLDISEAMLAICRQKLDKAAIGPDKARIQLADITDFSLDHKFDLIIAPYRVFQNLETDAEVNGLFRCVRKHLAHGGTCILNVFKPYWDPETLCHKWPTEGENLFDEIQLENERVTFHEKRLRVDPETMTLHCETIIRRYKEDALIDKATMGFVMRCYWPEDFQKLITNHGFKIINRWGGYAGESYGEGPELVIEFALSD